MYFIFLQMLQDTSKNQLNFVCWVGHPVYIWLLYRALGISVQDVIKKRFKLFYGK